MDATLYIYSAHNSTWNPPYPHPLRTPPQHFHTQLSAIGQEQTFGTIVPRDDGHGHLYSHHPSPLTSRSPPQSISPIVTNPHLSNSYRASECKVSKGSRSPSGSVLHWRQWKPPPLPTPSNNIPWVYELWPTSPQESSKTIMPCGARLSDVQFLANLLSMETASDECISEVQSLLSCPPKIALVKHIKESQARLFIDFLDQVLARSCLDDKLQQRGLRLLLKVCKAHGIIPSSYILHKEFIHVRWCYCRGGFGVVSNGEYSGRPVAIKDLEMGKRNGDAMFKRLCREIIIWKHFSHANILPLLGVFVSTDLRCFRILTEWMPNGNVMQYAKVNPKENRLRLLSEVAAGVTYLHERKVVHGDLKGANVLVDNLGTARVADFGFMSTVSSSTVLFSESAVSSGGTLCWMSPELLDPTRFRSEGRPTCESDSYALGMVVYEVLTGLRPFYQMCSFSPIFAVLKGERPEKPADSESLGFSDILWGLLRLCWSESSSDRPTALQFLDYFSPASLNWDPPPVYPIKVTDTSSAIESESSTSSLMSRRIQRGEWGD